MRRRLLLCAVVLGTTLMMPMMAQRLTPPVPYYKTGFEKMETQTFVDDTVEIEGVRWRIVNGRIVDDPKANIPFGKKALELTAGYVGDVPAMIEALDPIRGTQVSVSYETVEKAHELA